MLYLVYCSLIQMHRVILSCPAINFCLRMFCLRIGVYLHGKPKIFCLTKGRTLDLIIRHLTNQRNKNKILIITGSNQSDQDGSQDPSDSISQPTRYRRTITKYVFHSFIFVILYINRYLSSSSLHPPPPQWNKLV